MLPRTFRSEGRRSVYGPGRRSDANAFPRFGRRIAHARNDAPRFGFEIPVGAPLALCSALLALACDRTTAPTQGTPGITLVSGAIVDTIGAPAQVITVEVRDSAGRAVVGERVSFAGDDIRDRIGIFGPAVLTDKNGRASTRVEFYLLAGQTTVQVTVGKGAPYQQASFLATVLPGNAAGIRVAPRDTALYAGGTAALRVTAHDRARNVVPVLPRGTLTATVAEGLAVEGPAGTPVLRAGTALGRYVAVARLAGMIDSARVSIVPPGEIAVRILDTYRPDSSDKPDVFVAMQLDGSNRRVLLTGTLVDQLDLGLVQVPGTSSFVFQNTRPSVSLFRFAPHGTALTQLIGTPPDACDRSPSLTGDGRWLYFSRQGRASDGGCLVSTAVYRALLDGSRVEKVFDLSGHRTPAVSPDGRMVTYNVLGTLYVRDLGTGATRVLAQTGVQAQWSPDGTLIAYEAPGAIKIVRPDGSEVRSIARLSQRIVEDRRLGWSPDGRWLVGLYHNSSDLIEVATGRVLPLAFTIGLVDPVWIRSGSTASTSLHP